jgi:hypothetical protein
LSQKKSQNNHRKRHDTTSINRCLTFTCALTHVPLALCSRASRHTCSMNLSYAYTHPPNTRATYRSRASMIAHWSAPNMANALRGLRAGHYAPDSCPPQLHDAARPNAQHTTHLLTYNIPSPLPPKPAHPIRRAPPHHTESQDSLCSRILARTDKQTNRRGWLVVAIIIPGQRDDEVEGMKSRMDQPTCQDAHVRGKVCRSAWQARDALIGWRKGKHQHFVCFAHLFLTSVSRDEGRGASSRLLRETH